MTTTTEIPKKKSLQGEEYRKWHSRYHNTINDCATKYRNQNKEEINNRARNRFNTDPVYRQKKLDSMKRYREKRKKQKQALLKLKEEQDKEKQQLEIKIRDLALERQMLIDKLNQV